MFILKRLFFFTLLTVYATNYAQTVKFIDNKGTIRTIEQNVGNVAEIYDATGGQTINEGLFSDINFASAGIVDTIDFTVTTNSITIVNPGRYEVIYRVSTETTNNERNGGEFYLEVAGAELLGTRAYTYGRNNVNGKNTVTVIKIIAVTVPSLIKVKGQVYASSQVGTSSVVNMVLNGSSLIIKRIK